MTAQARAALDTDLATLTAFLTPDRWTTGAIACDDDGVDVEPDDPEAVRFCVLGACLRHGMKGLSVIRFLETRAHRSLATVNDVDGYDAVIALLHPVTDAEAAG